MEKQLVKSEDFGITTEKAQELTRGLDVIIAEKEVLKKQFLEIAQQEITPELCSVARELRFKIKSNRTKGINVWHKNNKAYFLSGGRFVDAIKKKESSENEKMEETLLSVENHFIDIENKRIIAKQLAESKRHEKIQNERVQKKRKSNLKNFKKLKRKELKRKELKRND